MSPVRSPRPRPRRPPPTGGDPVVTHSPRVLARYHSWTQVTSAAERATEGTAAPGPASAAGCGTQRPPAPSPVPQPRGVGNRPQRDGAAPAVRRAVRPRALPQRRTAPRRRAGPAASSGQELEDQRCDPPVVGVRQREAREQHLVARPRAPARGGPTGCRAQPAGVLLVDLVEWWCPTPSRAHARRSSSRRARVASAAAVKPAATSHGPAASGDDGSPAYAVTTVARPPCRTWLQSIAPSERTRVVAVRADHADVPAQRARCPTGSACTAAGRAHDSSRGRRTRARDTSGKRQSTGSRCDLPSSSAASPSMKAAAATALPRPSTEISASSGSEDRSRSQEPCRWDPPPVGVRCLQARQCARREEQDAARSESVRTAPAARSRGSGTQRLVQQDAVVGTGPRGRPARRGPRRSSPAGCRRPRPRRRRGRPSLPPNRRA